MTWLAPWMPFLVAGLTIPPLVLLYFLKLKRRVMPISSTLLWKRAVHDLQVNAPFQKLRKNLLLFLQILILILVAGALGKPMVEAMRRREKTLIVLIDQSASMNVVEADGRTRLEHAKEQAGRLIDDMDDEARAMVVAFCDRAATVSPFDSDRRKLKRLIEGIEPTESTTLLGEAMSLAEAYAQNFIIAGNAPGTDVAPTSAAPPATAVIFSDGRVADAEDLRLEQFKASAVELVTIGKRSDNVGITSLSARRNYERPEIVQVFCTVQNFGEQPVQVDAALYIDGVHSDVQELSLDAALPRAPEFIPGADPTTIIEPAESPEPVAGTSTVTAGLPASLAFDSVTMEGAGLIEVRLQKEDALATDNRAWVVVPPARPVRVLLVTRGNFFLERVLAVLPLTLTKMKPDAYEAAPDEKITDGQRCLFDVVIFDDHSTKRLPIGNYFFWGGIPQIEGVQMGESVENETLANWDETHPIMRHVAVASISVDRWNRLTIPNDAVTLIEGESSPVLAYLSREGSQYLLCAFPVLETDPVSGQTFLNTEWVRELDFVPFIYNSVQFLSSNLVTGGLRNLQPGEPVQLPVPEKASEVIVHRPDGTRDTIPTGGYSTIHYAKTRNVGVYRAEPSEAGRDRFAVNLFSAEESDIAPTSSLAIGGEAVAASGTFEKVNESLWPWLLLAALAVLLCEWIVYSKRVSV